MRGKLYGVGVSVGDPELLTFKAARIIRECAVIAIPAKSKESCAAWQSVSKLISGLDGKDVLYIDMPMTKDREALQKAHRKAAELIEKELAEGRDAAFLTIGDPCIYATYMYVHRIVEGDGFETEIINGITSFCVAAAAAGVSLCEEDEELHIIPASYGAEKALEYKGTKVFMKSGARLSETVEAIERKAQEGDTEVYMAQNCGMADERLFRSIAEIKEKGLKDASYFTTIIVKEKRHD